MVSLIKADKISYCRSNSNKVEFLCIVVILEGFESSRLIQAMLNELIKSISLKVMLKGVIQWKEIAFNVFLI